MNLPKRTFSAQLIFWLAQIVALSSSFAHAEEWGGDVLRDIRIGTFVTNLPKEGYTNFICASGARQPIPSWDNWKDCPADASGTHALQFSYDPETNRDGTVVAGHPVILTLLISDAGQVAGLHIATDPKARLYMRKKAFLLGKQAIFRFGSDGWFCTEGKPTADELPIGGVYVKERCTKALNGLTMDVERKLFRGADQGLKNFTSETQINIVQSKG